MYVGKWHNDGRPVQRGYSATNGLYRGGGGKFAKPQVDHAGREVTGYRGWVFQDDQGNLFPEHGVGLTADISRRFADAAIQVLDAATDQPLFLHVNFTAPHDPLLLPPGWQSAYAPDAMDLPASFLAQHPFDHGNFDGRDERLFKWPRTPEETRSEIAAYYAVISHMDQQVGRIIDHLQQAGKLNNTLVVFTSDHGLAVGSHGLRGKQNMYQHTIGVPLIFRGPGIPAGQQHASQCYLRDLFPTLCELAGIDSPGDRIDGVSLKPVIDGNQRQVHPFVVGYFRNFQRMIRTDNWKYIEYPDADRRQLFHLAEDPDELNDLSTSSEHQPVRDRLRRQMVDWFQQHGDHVYQQVP
jgi:arylsulfatase A-like enzyme